MVTIVYLVAGMSSRFGGKIKQFAIVGPNNETLIELSMLQAIKAGFDKIVFVVGEKTRIPFKQRFGNFFNNIPIFYVEQLFDVKERDKPWGTTDAVVSAKLVINENFVVCNGDDLYGVNAFKQARLFLEDCEKNSVVAIGYELDKVLLDEGKVNRGIFSISPDNFVLGIEEVFGIEKDKLSEKNLSNKTLTSMNLFGFEKNCLSLLENKLLGFKKQNFGNRAIECLLPIELSNLIKEEKIKMKLISTSEDWFGVTVPEDEAKIKDLLKSYEI